jgi:hypothetical protein
MARILKFIALFGRAGEKAKTALPQENAKNTKKSFFCGLCALLWQFISGFSQATQAFKEQASKGLTYSVLPLLDGKATQQ